MNIVYINHYAGSIYHGMEYRPYYLAREWVKHGHSVTIVASNYSHLRQKNIDIPDGQDYLIEYIDGIEYIWCRTIPYQVNGIKRVINIFHFLRQVRKLSAALIAKKPDFVISSSTYPFDAKIAFEIANQANAKFIHEVHDLWPLTPIEVGGMSKYHPFIWYMQKAEDFAYKNAYKVVSLLPKASEYMQSRGMLANKFAYIPNGVDVQEWHSEIDNLPNEHQNKLSKIHMEYKFIVGYAGGMGDSNALEYLMEAAKSLPEVAIVLVGNGVNRSKLIEETKFINNVFFLDAIKKSQVAKFLASCNVLYIGWHNLPIYRFGICPNKLFDYMLAKKPVVHAVSAGNDLVQESNCGISVSAGNVMEIVRAIKLMSGLKKEELDILGNNGYNYVLKNHDYKILATRFIDQVTK